MRRAPRPGRQAVGGGDAGSASVLVVAVAAVVLVLAVALALVVQGTVARARAQAAADLAAVSAARAAQRAAFHQAGAGEPCDVAATVAGRNDAALTGCEESAGGIVGVGVAIDTVAGPARADARAGPRR